MKPPRGALLLAVCLAVTGLLAACASVPYIPVEEGSRVVVRLYEPKGADGRQVELALANESYPELADLYSTRRADANLKRAPDRLVGELLASLDGAGLGVYGRRGAPDDPRGSRGYLFVDHDGVRTLFDEPPPGSDPEERKAYILMKLIMNEYYSHVGSKQYIDNPAGHDIFEGTR